MENKQAIIKDLRERNSKLTARLVRLQYNDLPNAKKKLLEDVCLTAHALYDLEQEEVNKTTIIGAKHYLDCSKILCEMYEVVEELNRNRKTIRGLQHGTK